MKLAKKPSAAAVALLRQATAIAPKRMKASDGLLPSVAHQKANPTSDHNTGLAVDLTHDPKNGVDCAVIFEKLKEDERVQYLIFNKKIWNRKYAKSGNRPYRGSNPHVKHLHISIRPDKSDDTSPWFWWINQPSLKSQVIASLQPKPKKKVAKDATIAPTKPEAVVCTCCKLHTWTVETKRKAI
jgi:hypothetical protein